MMTSELLRTTVIKEKVLKKKVFTEKTHLCVTLLWFMVQGRQILYDDNSLIKVHVLAFFTIES